MNTEKLQYVFFSSITVLSIVLFFLVIKPYASVLILAASLALVFHPLYERIFRIFKNDSTSALITIAIVVLIVFIPLSLLAVQISNEVPHLYTSLTDTTNNNYENALSAFLQKSFPRLHIPDISLDISAIASQGLTWFADNIGAVFSGIGQILFGVFLSLVGLFYFLKDGERLKRWLAHIIPLSAIYEREIFSEIRAVLAGVIRGTLVSAVIQGVVVGIGFLFFGIPNPAFWGVLVAVFSPIPIIGTWLVVIPAVGYLFLVNNATAGIGLTIWCVVFVNLIYNMVTPQLMRHGNEIHPFVILLSILGGIALFGPIGFLAGPLVAALVSSLLAIYPHLILKR